MERNMATQTLKLRIVGGYWTASWYDEHGRRRWKRFGNIRRISRNQAVEAFNAFHREWLDDPAVRDPRLGPKATVRQMAETNLSWAETYYRKPNGRPTGEAGNVRDAMRTVAELFGDKPANAITTADLKECQEAMIKAGLSRPTINARINRIRRVFRWGVERSVVKPEVWWGLKALASLKRGRSEARETKPVRPVPEQHVRKVHATLPAPLQAMIELQLMTGMRPGEIRMMRPIDIDISGSLWVYSPSEHKTEHHGRHRRIYLGPKSQAIIKPFLNRRLDAFLFDPRDAMQERYSDRKTHRRIPNMERRTDRKIGDHYTKGSYARAIARACLDVGVPHWTPNQLRHNCATRLRKEYGLEASRVVLGHAKVGATEIYAEIDEEKAMRIMQEVG